MVGSAKYGRLRRRASRAIPQQGRSPPPPPSKSAHPLTHPLTAAMYRPSAVVPNWQRLAQLAPPLQPGTFQVAMASRAEEAVPPPPPWASPRRHTNMRPSHDLLARRPPGRKRCSSRSRSSRYGGQYGVRERRAMRPRRRKDNECPLFVATASLLHSLAHSPGSLWHRCGSCPGT